MCPRARRISSFCENVAMLPRGTICSQYFCQRSWSRWRTDCRGVCALGVARAQVDAQQFVIGARFGEAALVNVSKGKRRISSFCEDFARLPRRTKCLHSCCQKSCSKWRI